MSKFLHDKLKIIFEFLGIIIVIGLGISGLTSLRYKILSRNVELRVDEEYDKIIPPNELSEFQTQKNYGCHNDIKVKSTRCAIQYTKYFAVDSNPVEEFQHISDYLDKLGWGNQDKNGNKVDLYRMYEKGYLPSALYEKENGYELELFLKFYSAKDKNDYYPRKEILKKLNENRSVYSISISADFVD